MMCCVGRGRFAQTLGRWRSRLLIVGLVLGSTLTAAVSADAASLSLSWNAPTTNADGTPLTDLVGYRVYVSTTNPSCPGTPSMSVASPTSAPSSGETASARITGLTAGSTYFVRVSAVDTANNESGCVAAVSGTARPDFDVTPTTSSSFGAIQIGTTVDRTFTVQNISAASLAVTASVASPYRIMSGASLSLAPGASQAVTVRFQPTASGTFAGNVTFSANGDTLSRGITGSATGETPAPAPQPNPVPVASSLSPASAVEGGTATTMTVNGSGFVAASVVQWNGTARTTTFVSATQLRIALTAADLATARSIPVTVLTPSPGGGTSGAVSFVVAAATSPSPVPAAAPAMAGSPSVTLAGTDSTGVTFTVAWSAGSGATSYRYVAAFTDGSTSLQNTVSALSFQLRMPYHASGAAALAFVCVRSLNGTLQSADQSCNAFTVPARPTSSPTSNPAPVATGLSPASTQAGSAGLTLTVNGSGFVNTSVVRWNGSSRTTTFVSASRLTATLGAGDLATARSVPVTVSTPAPGGGTSAALSFTVSAVAPAPGASSLSPASAVAGSGSLTLTVNGSGFVSTSVVRWNGATRTTTVVSGSQLRTTLSAADLATARSVPVTVSTPAPGGGTSAPLTFAITPAPLPVPVLGSLSPTSVAAGSTSLTLTVNGSGFVNTSVVRWNGTSRTTTFVSASQLRATITVADLASVGSAAVSVYTPAPGGGTSASRTFTISVPPVPSPTPTTRPGTPGTPRVAQLGYDGSSVSYLIGWAPGSGATSYRYAAHMNDGSGSWQGAVTSPWMILRLPYNSGGGVVCVVSVSAAGQTSASQACGAIPAN
jgi:Fibronectin type III domain